MYNKMIRVIKDINEVTLDDGTVKGEIPKGMIGEVFTVKEEFSEHYKVDAEAYYKGTSDFDIYKEEAEVLTEEEVKDILYKKWQRVGDKILEL